jgi:hypothetical protein
VLSQLLICLLSFQRRYTEAKLAGTTLVVWDTKDLATDQDSLWFPLVAVPSMLVVARLTQILISTYFLANTLPLKDVIMRDGIQEELYISEMMYANILRLGTTYTEASAQTLALTLAEDTATTQEVKSTEKVYIDMLAKNKHVNVFASDKIPSDKGGATTVFRPVTAHDWKEDATGARAFLKTTMEASPATISLFVSMACRDLGRPHKGQTNVCTPSYIVQPKVNVRDLTGGGRLDDQTGQIATALGRTKFHLSSHEMEACLYSVLVEEEVNAVGNKEEHAKLLPMVSTGFQQGTGRETLCGSPKAMAAAACDVDALWLALFGDKRSNCVDVDCALNDVEQATVIFSALIARLAIDYNGFRDVTDWMRLHRCLREVMWEDIRLDYRPTNENELYHEVRVMIQAMTPLRIALLDGLGRIGGTVYALLGRLPERDPAEVTARVDNKRIIKFDHEIYKKTGAGITLSLVCFDNNGDSGSKSWTKDEVRLYQDYSAWLQETYLVVTQRSIQDCMIDICRKLGDYHICGNVNHQPYTSLMPGEYRDVHKAKSDELNATWLEGLRRHVLHLIKNDKSPQVKEVWKELEDQVEKGEERTKWKEDKLGSKQGQLPLIEKKDMDKPKKLMAMIMLATQFQFAIGKKDMRSLIELQSFLRWNGKGVYGVYTEGEGEGGDDKEGQDNTPLGLPPHPDSDNMMGLLPTSNDPAITNDFDAVILWLIHRPQMLLGNSMAKKLQRDGTYQKSRLGNLGARYIMPAGSALLSLYNKVGPLLNMSEGLHNLMPNLHALLETNPFEDSKTWDGVAPYNTPHWYATIKPPGETTKFWSNIPTFVCILNWIAMRSDFEEVPEVERVFHFHRVAPLQYFDEEGSLKFKEDNDANGEGKKTAVATSWDMFTPKFVFEEQKFAKKKNKEVGKVAGATLLEMVDLLLNQESKLWPKFLKEDVDLAATKKALQQQIDTLCGYFDWKYHYYDAMGEIKTYTLLSSKNKPSLKIEERRKVLVGYVEVTSSDGIGAVTRMPVRKHRMAELAEQKKKRKDEKEEGVHQLGSTSSNGNEDVLTTEKGNDKRKRKGVSHDQESNRDDSDGSDDPVGEEMRGGSGVNALSELIKVGTPVGGHTDPDNGDDDHGDESEVENDNLDNREGGGDTNTGSVVWTQDEPYSEEMMQEAAEDRRYSHNYLSKTEKDYMERELEDERKDPSAMLEQLGNECLERAGRYFLHSELAGRFMADKRKQHEQFWKDVDRDHFEQQEEMKWRDQFHLDRREVVEMMWTEGDKQLAVRKDEGSSLMGNDFGKIMGATMKGHAVDYATWIEEEVRDKNLYTPAAEEQTGDGAVSYFNCCIQTALEGASIPSSEFEEMKIKTPVWRETNWKEQQYRPLVCAESATQSSSPVKSPEPKERSGQKRKAERSVQEKKGSSSKKQDTTPTTPKFQSRGEVLKQAKKLKEALKEASKAGETSSKKSKTKAKHS